MTVILRPWLDLHTEPWRPEVGLRKAARKVRRNIRPFTDEYTMRSGRRVYLLADGRLINLAAAEGHPACVMDMSFAGQALTTEMLARRGAKRRLPVAVHEVPASIDATVASLKLKSMGTAIDRLTPEQERYLFSWELGT